MISKKVLLTVIVLSCVGAFFSGATAPHKANAADTDNFNPGLIISDDIFTQKNAMSAAQIQDFLEQKNSKCLKDFITLGLYDADGNGLGDEPYGKGNGTKVRASTLIWQAAQIYDINPRVILVTLQKEQSLITRQDCPSYAYRSALGYACPDNQPCDSSAYGLTRQIDYGVWHFDGFFHDTYPIPPTVPGTKTIAYNPDSRCGGDKITIQNRATAALYSYTPYQPNSYSLNGGTIDDYPRCGAFGNLNFWRFFNDWFGSSVRLTYEGLTVPRWMETAQALYKVNLYSGKVAQSKIAVSTDIRFSSKIYLNGQWYLRTATDTQNNRALGIPISKLKEIEYQSFAIPRHLVVSTSTSKINPLTGKTSGTTIAKNSYLYFDSLIRVNGSLYYRTSQDTESNSNTAIPASRVKEIPYEQLTLSRWMRISSTSPKQTIPGLSDVGTPLAAGSHVFFTSKLTYEGQLYLRTKTDTQNKRDYVVPISALEEIPFTANSQGESGWKTTSVDTYKYDPRTGNRIGPLVKKGTSFYTLDQITVNGQKYYRTQADKGYGRFKAILAYATEVPDFTTMTVPRVISTNGPTRLLDMSSPTLRPVRSVGTNTRHHFDSKIVLNDKLYLRTSLRTASDQPYAIPIADLRD